MKKLNAIVVFFTVIVLLSVSCGKKNEGTPLAPSGETVVSDPDYYAGDFFLPDTLTGDTGIQIYYLPSAIDLNTGDIRLVYGGTASDLSDAPYTNELQSNISLPYLDSYYFSFSTPITEGQLIGLYKKDALENYALVAKTKALSTFPVITVDRLMSYTGDDCVKILFDANANSYYAGLLVTVRETNHFNKRIVAHIPPQAAGGTYTFEIAPPLQTDERIEIAYVTAENYFDVYESAVVPRPVSQTPIIALGNVAPGWTPAVKNSGAVGVYPPGTLAFIISANENLSAPVATKTNDETIIFYTGGNSLSYDNVFHANLFENGYFGIIQINGGVETTLATQKIKSVKFDFSPALVTVGTTALSITARDIDFYGISGHYRVISATSNERISGTIPYIAKDSSWNIDLSGVSLALKDKIYIGACNLHTNILVRPPGYVAPSISVTASAGTTSVTVTIGNAAFDPSADDLIITIRRFGGSPTNITVPVTSVLAIGANAIPIGITLQTGDSIHYSINGVGYGFYI